jgi:hypothetical protein
MGGMKEATADFAFRNCMDVSHAKLSKTRRLIFKQLPCLSQRLNCGNALKK